MSWTSIVKTIAGAIMPKDDDDYVPIRPLPQRKIRYGFGRTIANNIDSSFGSIITPLGAGMTVNQTGGNLVMTAGTSINQDTILRFDHAIADNFTLRWSTVLSQRIANQSFIVELVDVIGDSLPTTITNATTVAVTIPAPKMTELGWDARNIGQKVTLGNYAGTGTFVPGTEGTIASIAGNVVTFTVAGFAAGTGTCSLFGWNYHRFTYTGTTATTMSYSTQRGGWPGAVGGATINTTATPGHIGILNVEDNIAAVYDQLRVGATGLQTSPRQSAVQDMPGEDAELHLQLRIVNGTVAPASSTTWTIAFVDMEVYASQQVSMTSVRTQSANSTLPVLVQGGSLSATTTPGNQTAYALTTAASTNAALIGANSTSRKLFEITVFNPTAATIYVKIYAKATAPTVGTDVPIMTIPVATNSFAYWNAATGKQMTAGIAIAVTAGPLATDTAAVAAGAQISATFI